MTDWSLYPNFTAAEFRCRETGECEMKASFLARLQRLRTELGEAMHVTSGFRSTRHSVERAKPQPGTHTFGRAVDIAANGRLQYQIIRLAPSFGFTGIGIAKTFIHLDDWDGGPRPNVWIY